MSEKKKTWHHRLSLEEINALPGRELKVKRTRSSKTYSLGNGLYQSVIYPDAVHYRNEKGEWEDIDHTMINEGAALCDHSGDLAVKLAPGGCVTLTKGEHRLSWQIAGAASVEAAAENAKVTIFRHNENRRIENRAVYANIFPGVDFICDLKPNRFKDTLVFKNAAALRPVEFLLHAECLTLRQSPSGAVVAMCGDKTVFRLPTPAVANENGEVIPGSAHAVLTQVSNSDWRWVCEVDADFATTASYPICLDPVVENQQADTGLSMAYTSTKKPTTNYTASGNSTILAYDDYSLGKVCSYLQFQQSALPEIDSSYYVTAATLSMYTVDPAPSMSTAVYLKEVESPWTQSAITYNTRPQVADKAVEYCMAPTAYGMKLDFNITNQVRKWYNGENHGVMLETTAGSVVRLGAAGASSRKPYVTITYVSLAGLENYLVQDSIGCGRAGTAHIGLFNGNLVFSHQETAMNGNLMPVSISRYYNSCYRDVNPFGVGYGWKLSTQQTLHKETLGSTIYYVYMDGDGTRHHFKQESGEWKDLSGLEYTLTLDTSAETATITSKSDSKMVFALPTEEFNGNYANVGMLQSITDACGNTATFVHDANRVFLSATDGAIRPTNGVITDGELCSITAPGMPAVGYKYENGYLTEITHVDGVKSTYEYSTADETAGLLVSVKAHCANGNDHLIAKLYYHETAPYRVREVHLLNAAGEVYTGRRYTYGNCCTAVTELYPDASGNLVEGKSLHYHFNDAGNLVSVNDELGYGRFLGYDDTAAPLNHPTFVSKMQRAVTNYLKNHHFITVNTDWTIDKMDSTGEGGYNSDAYYIGGRSYFLKKTSANGRISTYQTVALVKGKPYTFSCQYKTLNAAKAQLRLEWQNSAGEAQYAESPAFASTSRWNRTHVSFSLPEDAASNVVTVRIMAAGGIGTVWVDAAQLEDGLVPNRYNLLENGTFYMNDSGRPMYWSTGYNTDTEDIDGVTTQIAPGRPAELTGNVVRLYGKPGMTKVIDQTVPSIGNAGDTFVAGGWSWSNCRPRNDATNSRYEMQILARPYVSSGIAQFQSVGCVRWSEEWSGWQFAAIPVVIPFRYTDIYVKLYYQNNLNEAQFSNLFLHKEEFGKTFAYDAKGNMTSVKNLAALESDAEYDDFNNLTSYCQPGRSERYTLDWGNTDTDKKKHLLRSKTSPLGIVQRTQYDAESENAASTKGLPVETSMENAAGTMKIVSKAEYTTDKNYVYTQTDARNKTVTTVTDTNRGTVTSVTDPKNQTVDYTYDALNRVTKVETTVNNLTYRNEYAYTDDKLTKICHNTSASTADDVVYTFDYDDQDRRTTVKVGNQLLSRNVYNDTAGDRYGTLERMEYGNGHVVRNSYDEFKRVVGVQYDDDETDRYSYEYGANGQVARVTNHELNRTVLSEHDSCSRPMRVTHMEGDAHVYTGEVTYDVHNNLASFEEQVGTARTPYTTTFSYDEENRPTLLKYGSDTDKVAYNYDGLGRIEKRSLTVGGTARETSYAYIAGGHGEGSTAGLIATIEQTGGNFTYTYDDNGNITSVVQDGVTTSYTYDALGQLIRVVDGHEGATWEYSYDQGGNILSKKKYVNGELAESMTFGYVHEGSSLDAEQERENKWRDLLKYVNGQRITYDEIGNPKNDGTWTYTWEKGRQLRRMSKSDRTVEFKYNENGLRIQKVLNPDTSNEEVTNYTLHGKNIVHMTKDKGQQHDDLHFYYDASNKPAIVEYNGTKYAYVHNLQGDIVAILDSNGTAVVQYKYDAWGKPFEPTGSMKDDLGKLNPFRYRGYVYDEETELYYLRSRFYRLELCRFLNADGFITNNLFAYCFNAPVYVCDKNGYDWDEIGFDPAANDIQFMQEVYPKIMSYMRIALDYRYPGKNKKYNDTGVGHRLATYTPEGKLKRQGVTDCSHFTYEVTGAGNTTSPKRYSEVLDIYKGNLFVDGELSVELCQGMEVYNESTGHVGILLLYTLDKEVGEEWCVAQSTSEHITRSRVLFENDPHRGPNITSFYPKDGTAPTWHYYTMPRYWKDLTQP